jgi:hypothetical protein
MSPLYRLPGSRFSAVAPDWKGKTVVVLGGGPSLTITQVFDVAAATRWPGTKCIAVNNTFLWAPWANVSYAADARWHRWMSEGIDLPAIRLKAKDVRKRWHDFGGQKCTIEADKLLDDHLVHVLRNRDHPHHGVGLSRDPRALVTGRNSGWQAINLAVLAGAKKIVLLGFDGQQDKEGRSHWHGDHPRPTPQAAYSEYALSMSSGENALIDAGVEVLNCSPGSAINSFPKCELASALR